MASIQTDTHDRDSYKLPRGGREAIRLTAQHHVLASRQGWLLHPKIAHAIQDIAQPRIADVATGTGLWALDMAQQMPHAEVIGLDISDRQFSPAWTWPSNMSLALHDLLDEVPAEYRGQFDVVHVRLLLVAGPSVDKAVFIDQFRTLLRPGGWLQWDELALPHHIGYCPSSKALVKPVKPDVHPIVQVLVKYLRIDNRIDWINRFEEALAQAGGFDEAEKFDVPIRAHLLQMESDLCVAVKTEIVNMLASNNGVAKSSMINELHEALAQLHADVEKGMLFAHNWNVCIAKKDLTCSKFNHANGDRRM